MFAPRALGRFLGMEEHAELLRAYGAREIVAGVGILAQDDPTPWMWGRVGGDVLDLGTLAMGLGRSNPQRGNVAIAVGAVAGVTALDVLCARTLPTTTAGRRCGCGTTARAAACRARPKRCAVPRATSRRQRTCGPRTRCAPTPSADQGRGGARPGRERAPRRSAVGTAGRVWRATGRRAASRSR